ncbi:MAG: histidine kinase dimerization/phospho-acceptor domain-containing protein [Isosphaeraceae bacterium]
MAITYIFEEVPARYEELASRLKRAGHATAPLGTLPEAELLLRGGRAEAVVLITGPQGWSERISALCRAAQRAQVPSLMIADPTTDPALLAEADDWASPDATPEEWTARLSGLTTRRARAARTVRELSASPRDRPNRSFLAMAIHDLRTPLHVIGLTLDSIKQNQVTGGVHFVEDVRLLEDNLRSLDRMLVQLNDHDRISDPSASLKPAVFSPRSLLEGLLESGLGKPWEPDRPWTLVVEDSCPKVVTLDLWRARLAVQSALRNAQAAAGDQPVRITLSGAAGRCRIELAVDRPPPRSVTSVWLSPTDFRRLLGSPGERRGLDLAIAARVSEAFGGTARLEVDPATGTQVVLDWPVNLSETSKDGSPPPGDGPAH